MPKLPPECFIYMRNKKTGFVVKWNTSLNNVVTMATMVVVGTAYM